MLIPFIYSNSTKPKICSAAQNLQVHSLIKIECSFSDLLARSKILWLTIQIECNISKCTKDVDGQILVIKLLRPKNI